MQRPQNQEYFNQNSNLISIVDSSSADYKSLPSEYTQIEYNRIFNNSTKGYKNGIDTGIMFCDADKIEFTFKSTDSQPVIFICGYPSREPCYGINGGPYSAGFESVTASPRLYFDQVSDGTKRTMTIDYTTQTTITIKFGFFTNSSWSRTIDWYEFKIFNGEDLLQDMIPCYDSNYIFGFYDIVNGGFYKNVSNGFFNFPNYNPVAYSNTLSGSGTETDPYLIQDECDLYDIRNASNAKYFKLTNDIYLNHGKFVEEEDGTINYYSRKGKNDGLYIWGSVGNNLSNSIIDGAGHSIYGLYGQSGFAGRFELGSDFYYSKFIIKNLNFKNAYVNGSNYSCCIVCSGGFGGQMINCTTDGWNRSTGSYCAGFTGRLYGKIINCTNYVKFISGSGIAGTIESTGLIENCVNYGDGTCENDGKKTCGIAWWIKGILLNCKNYRQAQYGIFGTLSTGAVVANCVNYYEKTTNAGLGETCNGKVYGCSSYANTTYGLVDTLSSTGEIYCCESRGNMSYYVANKINAGGIVKNCLLGGNCEQSAVATNKGSLINVVFDGENKKQYYGTDFSSFFYTWKEGRIGLVALERTGLYRAQLTERYLYREFFLSQDHIYEPSEEDREYVDGIKQKQFEKDFVQLEYLESTGSQYIDTGVLCKKTGTLKFETEIQYTRTAGRQLMGYDWPGDFEVNASGVFDGFGQYSTDKYDIYEIFFDMDNRISKRKLNDFEEREDALSSVNSTRGNITLFALGQYKGYYCYCKMKSFKICVDGILVRDFIPAMRKSDGELGLFDKIDRKFYGNAGTGSFTGA